MLSISIKGLFGRFNYDVNLNKDGLTIITGPNGYGKSTILKCIDALSKGREGVSFFYSLDFNSIDFEFESKKIKIQKDSKKLLVNGVKTDIKLWENTIRERMYLTAYANARRDKSNIEDMLEYERYMNDIYFQNHVKRYAQNAIDSIPRKFEDELNKVQRLLGEIYFIKEQRLIREKNGSSSDDKLINVIEELPTKFKILMSEVMSKYSSVSNELDSSYPNRLFSNEAKISEEDYKSNIEIMNTKFEKLNKYDLSTMQNLNNVLFRDEHARALKIYFDDFETKYKVYDDFINKLDIFTNIINERLSFKKIVISREFGISIVNGEKPSNKLDLMQLSSGEKQEIVLFYQLIFETSNNILLLIDEPEISLHITWQKKFMDDLMKIIKYKNMNVIVATHSPQIINNHWDNQIDLGEIYAEQLDKK